MRKFWQFLLAFYLVYWGSLVNAAIEPCDISGVKEGAFQANSQPDGQGTNTYYRLWYDRDLKKLIVTNCGTDAVNCDEDSEPQWSSPVSITPSMISLPGFGTTIFKTNGATNYNALWFVNRHGKAGASLSQNPNDPNDVDIVVRNCGFSWNQTLPAQAIITAPITQGGLGLIANNITPAMTVNNNVGQWFSMPYISNPGSVTFQCDALNSGNPIVIAPNSRLTNPGCPPTPHSSPIKGMNYIYGSTSGTAGGSWPTYWAQIVAIYGVAFLGFLALGRSKFGRGLL